MLDFSRFVYDFNIIIANLNLIDSFFHSLQIPIITPFLLHRQMPFGTIFNCKRNTYQKFYVCHREPSLYK